MKTARLILLASALCLTGVLFTACAGDKDGHEETGSSTAKASESTTASQSSFATGDIDGDGFIEDIVTDAGDIVDSAVSGVEDIADELIPDVSD